MSQKSSVPQAISFVSQVLKRDIYRSALSPERHALSSGAFSGRLSLAEKFGFPATQTWVRRDSGLMRVLVSRKTEHFRAGIK